MHYYICGLIRDLERFATSSTHHDIMRRYKKNKKNKL